MKACYEFAGLELLTSDWISALGTVVIGAAAVYFAREAHVLSERSVQAQEASRERNRRVALGRILHSIMAARAASRRLTRRLNEELADGGAEGEIVSVLIRQCTTVIGEVSTGQDALEHLDESLIAALGTLRGEIPRYVIALEEAERRTKALGNTKVDKAFSDAIGEFVDDLNKDFDPCEALLRKALPS